MKKNHCCIVFSCLFAAAALLAGCSNNQEAPATTQAEESATESVAEGATEAAAETSAPEELEEIKVAVTIGTPHANPAVIADEKGIYAEHGLTAEIQSYASGVAKMEALPSGSWDVCILAIPGWMGGGLNYGLKIVGMGPWDEDGIDLYARPDSDIIQAGKGHIEGYPDIYGTPELWKGKTVLLPTGTTAHMTLIATLSAMGLTEEDVVINNIDVAAGYTAFKAGQGDLVGSWTVHSVYNQNDGNIAATSATAAGIRIPIVICASEQALAEKPEAVKNFLAAYSEGAKYQEENKEEASQIMADYNNKNGFKTDYDSCYALIEKRQTPSIEEQLSIFQEGEMEAMVKSNFDFFFNMGRYEEADWDVLQSNISSEVLESLGQ